MSSGNRKPQLNFKCHSKEYELLCTCDLVVLLLLYVNTFSKKTIMGYILENLLKQ